MYNTNNIDNTSHH